MKKRTFDVIGIYLVLIINYKIMNKYKILILEILK